ncbi:MAG: MerR family transcriptional regulator, partial [Acidimicrobiales bacterium]
ADVMGEVSADVMGEVSIDELARLAGTTTRNIRSYQEKGLLMPPRISGRTGFYGQEHLRTLKLIARLLSRGYSLASIGELLSAWESRRSLSVVLGFEEVLRAPFVEEGPRRFSAAEVAAMFPDVPLEQAGRAAELGLAQPDPDEEGALISAVPGLIQAGAELVAQGVPLVAVLDVAAEIKVHVEAVAERFVALFLEYLWEPFLAQGMPPERLGELTEMLRRQRPLAAQAVTAVLGQALESAVDGAIAIEAGRLAAASGVGLEPC